jgi:hypothetical protein
MAPEHQAAFRKVLLAVTEPILEKQEELSAENTILLGELRALKSGQAGPRQPERAERAEASAPYQPTREAIGKDPVGELDKMLADRLSRIVPALEAQFSEKSGRENAITQERLDLIRAYPQLDQHSASFDEDFYTRVDELIGQKGKAAGRYYQGLFHDSAKIAELEFLKGGKMKLPESKEKPLPTLREKIRGLTLGKPFDGERPTDSNTGGWRAEMERNLSVREIKAMEAVCKRENLSLEKVWSNTKAVLPEVK